MVDRSSSAAQTLLFFPRPIIWVSPLSTFLIDKNRHFVPVSMMATWKSFLMIIHYCLSGIRFFFRVIHISTTMYLALIVGIVIVLVFLSNNKPNISFSMLQCAYTFYSFFKDIMSFPPVSPVTSYGGGGVNPMKGCLYDPAQ